jgi:hypothetical protein
MPKPLAPIVLYAHLAEASAVLSQQITYLGAEHPLALRLEHAWLRLDDLIEQLPAALAWDAERQEQKDDDA